MLLADQGATVIQVERPQGEPARVHPAFATWNRGKQSVVLALQTPDALIGFRGLMLLRCPRSGTHF
jgi:crotonobetainyl-CoA:carnitine CoA-transferase CaiB-like acyl-CoA transferase